MASGLLEKLLVRAYSAPDYAESSLVDTFEAYVNPSEITLAYEMEYDSAQGAGTTGSRMDFKKVKPGDMSLTFFLDGTGANGVKITVQDEVARFQTVTGYNGDIHRPNYLKVAWGTIQVKRCVLKSASIAYKLFKPDGTPLRATISATFVDAVEDETRVALAQDSSPDLTHVRVLRAGDTLAELCRQIYGDPLLYLKVARANNLDGTRRLAPGTRVRFPAARPLGLAMPAERTLPIAAEQREFTVKVNGEEVPRENALQAASIVAAANRIASARLSYVDGSAGAGDFPLSNQDLFAPGAAIEISAGSASDAKLIFKGIVVGQRLRVREASPSRLVVDCRHDAVRLSLLRRSAHFFDQTDADAIESLLGAAGVTGEVDATAVTHKQLVQHDCSDWDFIVARAAACGLLVLTRGAELALRAPALGSAVAELRYGATLLELDAEVDARRQAQELQVLAWSAADQAVHTQDAQAPAFKPPGNFDPDTLAGGAGSALRQLRHAALDDAEATALANAAWLRTRVDMASGRVKCVGIASILPGDTVTLAGVGERFSGDVLVTGVRHEFDTTGGWKTHLQFGSSAPDPALRQRLQANRTAALLAPVAGLQAGVVTDIEDPDGEFRVRVALPLEVAGDDGVWARVARADAGDDRGWVFFPEVGDEVLVGFLDDDPRQPVVLGMLHSSAKAAPLAASSANPHKGYKSRSGIELLFDDEKKSVKLSTPGGNSLLLDDDAQGLTIEDQNGNKLVFGPSGISIESSKALALKSGTDGKLEAGTTLDVKASAALTLEGTASNDIKSGGVVKVAGSAVQIG